MSENDSHTPTGAAGQPDDATPVMLSYATPSAMPSAKICGISNPRSSIVAYFIGALLPIVGLMAAEQLNDPVVTRQMRLGDYSPLANDLLIALMIAGIVTTLFAFALTRRVYPASWRRRKCRSPKALLVGVAHPLLIFAASAASSHAEPEIGRLIRTALIVVFFSVPILSGIWLRRGSSW